MGAGHRRSAGDSVSFADELIGVEAEVGEGGAQGRDHVLEVGGEVGSVGLLVVDGAAAGERAPVPVPQFMRERAESEPDPRRMIAQLVEFWRSALPRTAPVFRIIREAAAADPEIAALERGRSAQRLRNYQQAAQLLADRKALRQRMTIEEAAAAIFAIGHPETYRSLVLDGDWDED